MFSDLPSKNVVLKPQHNNSDCGLYMLMYIERFARHGHELDPPLESPGATSKWDDHKDLQFQISNINGLRTQMLAKIKHLGEQQRKQKEAAVGASSAPLPPSS